MPIPGGAYALQQSLSFYHVNGSRRNSSLTQIPDDVLAFNETQRYFSENLKCTIGLYERIIPYNLGKLTGVLVIEAKQDISHNGIFILLKGHSLEKQKKKDLNRLSDEIKKPVKAVKFNILGYGKNSRQEAGSYNVDAGTESYPLELSLPKSVEDLPPPQISSDGKLVYRVQAFMFSGEKCVQVAETMIQFQGYNNLMDNPQESSTPIKIEQQLHYKKNYLSRKKFVDVYCSSDVSGYLPGEILDFLLVAKNPDKIPLECKAELVQKTWYQARSTNFPAVAASQRRLSVKMLKTTVAVAEKVEIKEVSKELLWKGKLRVPRCLTPTYKFDFFNSISYILRVTVKVHGDKDAKVVGDVPIYVGTTRERLGDESDDDENELDLGGEGDSEADSHSGAETPLVRGASAMLSSRSMISLYRRPSSPSVPSPSRLRAGSISSAHSFYSNASSTPSIFKLPPPYSQLSSRRPTLETLPPEYSEVALQEQPSQEDPDDTPKEE